MQKNAIVPYILIMAFGIGLIFFLSLEGANNQDEIAEEHASEEEGGSGGGEEEPTDDGSGDEGEGDTAFDPEAHAQQNCISCHGSSYEGGMGPSLIGLDMPQEEVEDVLLNGRGAMPGGLVPEENVSAMAEWVLSLE
ncbi:cytochrome c550 [Planococcus salinus]|uniref:Cytochrome c n=1 Tax=Planococcus salinus TaxID=1848460 RepID=A0A3M8PBN5_9BACL|nr:cytochrome c [Planococcus salinus]RNF41032.1 cytochrome c [Planococcus salinus]